MNEIGLTSFRLRFTVLCILCFIFYLAVVNEREILFKWMCLYEGEVMENWKRTTSQNYFKYVSTGSVPGIREKLKFSPSWNYFYVDDYFVLSSETRTRDTVRYGVEYYPLYGLTNEKNFASRALELKRYGSSNLFSGWRWMECRSCCGYNSHWNKS